MKKVFICLITLIILALLVTGGYLIYKKLNKKEDKPNVPKVVSIIYMDINPSIEIHLDKDNNVIEVKAVNEDAKEIITDDLKNIKYDEAIKKIADNVVEKGYAKNGKVTILISTTGSVEVSNVENTLKEELNAKEVTATVVAKKITDDAKAKAEEYGISESKASLIDEVISKNENLTYEELKDKTIDELSKITEKKEETKKENQNSTPKNNNNSGSSSSDHKGTSNKSIADLEAEGMLQPEQMKPIFKKKYGIGETFNAMFNGYSDKRCKYNMAYEIEMVEELYKHTAIMCQFDELVFDYKKTQLVSSIISKDKAYEIALKWFKDTYGYDEDEISSHTNNLGYSDLYSYLYEYSITLACKMAGQYVIRINAVNGEIVQAYKW